MCASIVPRIYYKWANKHIDLLVKHTYHRKTDLKLRSISEKSWNEPSTDKCRNGPVFSRTLQNGACASQVLSTYYTRTRVRSRVIGYEANSQGTVREKGTPSRLWYFRSELDIPSASCFSGIAAAFAFALRRLHHRRRCVTLLREWYTFAVWVCRVRQSAVCVLGWSLCWHLERIRLENGISRAVS